MTPEQARSYEAFIKDLRTKWQGLPWPQKGTKVKCPRCFQPATLAVQPPPGPLDATPPFAFCGRDGIVWLEPSTEAGAVVTVSPVFEAS